MKIVLGLGNPGNEYRKTRHNIGRAVIDMLAKNEDFTDWQKKSRLQAEINEGNIAGGKVILAKSLLYMNESGRSVQLLKNFYKVPAASFWLVYDDVDLPLGELRIRQSGSAGTHNGMRSIFSHTDGKNLVRFRCGIGRAGKIGDLSRFVLQPFGRSEKVIVKKMSALMVEALQTALNEGVEAAMNQFNNTTLV